MEWVGGDTHYAGGFSEAGTCDLISGIPVMQLVKTLAMTLMWNVMRKRGREFGFALQVQVVKILLEMLLFC